MEREAPALREPATAPMPATFDSERSALPTTFQLAHLAALLAAQPESAKIPPAEVALEALQLWDAAQAVLAERENELAGCQE